MAKKNPDPIVDAFEGYAPIAGLEHLGRHIVDASGMPSGSPANFEALRGQSHEYQPTDEERAAAIERVKREFGG